ncbi:MAG: hypothetical protein ABI606_20450 [Rhodoferax sp.]
MPAYNFQNRFAPLVRSGSKKTTIRGREARIGSTAYLFTGMRTKACQRLGQSEIINCTPIKLGWRDNGCPRVQFRSQQLNTEQIAELAQGEGFSSAREMVSWFEKTYKQITHTNDGGADVYAGFLIDWIPLTEAE